MEIVIVIISIVIVFLVISSISESNRRKRERELIRSVTSLNRGTSSEKSLVLQLLKKGIPSETIFHDLLIKKTNNEFSQLNKIFFLKF